MTPQQLYDWPCESIQTTSFGYCTSEEYENEHPKKILKVLNDSRHAKTTFVRSPVSGNT